MPAKVQKQVSVRPTITDRDMENPRTTNDITTDPDYDDENTELKKAIFGDNDAKEEQTPQTNTSTIIFVVISLIIVVLIVIIIWLLTRQNEAKKLDEEEIRRRMTQHRGMSRPPGYENQQQGHRRYAKGMPQDANREGAENGEPHPRYLAQNQAHYAQNNQYAQGNHVQNPGNQQQGQPHGQYEQNTQTRPEPSRNREGAEKHNKEELKNLLEQTEKLTNTNHVEELTDTDRKLLKNQEDSIIEVSTDDE